MWQTLLFQTAFNVLEQFHFGFSIVLKRLISVKEEFKSLSRMTQKKVRSIYSKRFLLNQSATFVNDIPYHNHKLNVLEFDELAEKKPSKRFAKVQHK